MDVVYEEAGILIVDKPSGLLSQPGRGAELQDSALTRIQAAYGWAELVHRLDRDTSGLLMLALDAEIHRLMSQAFAERRVEKHYVALCTGEISGISGSIVCPLARIGTNPPRYAAHSEGRIAVTHWEQIERKPSRTRLRLFPITGRSHQLRAHFEAIGHPLLGDPIYGSLDSNRLMLHAERLGFHHPMLSLWVDVISPPPF